MLIKYLRLKNFGGVYTSMSKEDLIIDFNPINNIMLLIGPNASGKTTILSALHPFAYPGNMDIRNNSRLILEDKIGLKEIHFNKNGDDIKVKHIYTPTNTGHSVKSFISVNGEEKNPNGNVGSFSEMVKIYLDVEIDFLKLSRLGSNVSGLIEMKSTERKKYMSNILSDVDTYSIMYKKINKDFASLNTIMKSIRNKLEKIDIGNIDDAIELKDVYEYRLSDTNTVYNKLIGDISTSQYIYNELLNEDIKDKIKKCNKEIKSLILKIDKNNNIVETMSLELGDISRDNIMAEIDTLEREKISLELKKDMELQRLNELYNMKQKTEFTMSSEKELDDMISLKKSIISNVSVSKKSLQAFKFNLSKDELYTTINLIDDIVNLFLDGLSYIQSYVIKEVYDILLRRENIDRFISTNIDRIDYEVSLIETELKLYSNTTKSNGIEILYDLHDDCELCPYKKKLNKLTKTIDDDKFNNLINDKQRLLNMRDNYLNMKPVYTFMLSIENKVKSNRDIFNTLGISIEDILNGKTFEKEKRLLIDEISIHDDLLEIEKLMSEIVRLDLKISEFTNNMNSSPIQLSEINKSIEECINNRNSLTDEMASVDGNLVRLKKCINDIDISNTAYNDLNIDMNMKAELENEIDLLEIKMEKFIDIENKLKEYNSEKCLLESKMKQDKLEIDKLSYRINSHNDCMDELKSLTEKYDELSIIREALSSTKGIPVLFIKLYLKNTTSIVNNILKDLFNSMIELDDFEINDTEFKIPYTKNGLSIADISYASQGEKSIINLALSFALMEQSLKTYNILLLDEVDATLDENNRRMFIPLLKDRLSTFGCEQVFMISHNNAFDNTPVDILMTRDYDIDNFKNIGQVIKI